MKPGDTLTYSVPNPKCEGLVLGDSYTLDNLFKGRVELKEHPRNLFPVQAFSKPECTHSEHVYDTRLRDGYRYRVYQCDKCSAKRSTVEIDIPTPGKGSSDARWRGKLMRLLDGDQCKALVEFIEATRRRLCLSTDITD